MIEFERWRNDHIVVSNDQIMFGESADNCGTAGLNTCVVLQASTVSLNCQILITYLKDCRDHSCSSNTRQTHSSEVVCDTTNLFADPMYYNLSARIKHMRNLQKVKHTLSQFGVDRIPGAEAASKKITTHLSPDGEVSISYETEDLVINPDRSGTEYNLYAHL